MPMTLESLKQHLAKFERQDTAEHCPRYLFRGQTQHYDTITPLIARRPSPAAITQLYRLFSDASLFATGIGGYHVSRRNGIGLLQHYALPTPFIDFSGCLEVAVFFSLLGATAGTDAVIYVLDRSLLPATALSFELDFFALPPSEGGLKHRHWRQDAFVVGPKDWVSSSSHAGFDLNCAPFKSAITTHTYTVSASDQAQISDIMSLTNDPLPHCIAGLIELWASQRLSEPLHNDMRSITGTVSEQGWMAQALVTPKLATLVTGNAASLIGNYTLSYGRSATMGYGAAIATIKSPNTVQITGNLPDGSVLNVNTLATSDGSSVGIPVFAPLAGGKGIYIGWVNALFDSGNWTFSELPGRYFADGGNSWVTTQIHRHQKSTVGQPVTGWTYGEINLFNGGITTSVAPSYIVISNNTIKVWQTTVSQTLAVDANSGAFSGSFMHPVTKKATPCKGVLIPGASGMEGYGWFMGPSGTGSIAISLTDVQPPPDWAPKNLSGIAIQFADSQHGSINIIFTTATQGATTDSTSASAFSYAYQKSGLTTGKLKITTMISVLSLDITFTAADTLTIIGTETPGGIINYAATVASMSAVYAPTTFDGTSWLVTNTKDGSASMVDFSGKQVFLQDNMGNFAGTYSYRKTGSNTATMGITPSGRASLSMIVTFTSPGIAYAKNSKGDQFLLQRQ